MNNKPKIIQCKKNSDHRGKNFHVNDFDLSPVKRIYVIENKNIFINRGWKGHMIESRWFFCTMESMEIQVVPINSFSERKNKIVKFNLCEEELNMLFVPNGYATLVKQIKDKSRLAAMSDYLIGISNDEGLRWDSSFFEI